MSERFERRGVRFSLSRLARTHNDRRPRKGRPLPHAHQSPNARAAPARPAFIRGRDGTELKRELRAKQNAIGFFFTDIRRDERREFRIEA
ncbi:MAG: hypothetical protein Tsb0010_07990 [Parvularculaceae bacterium]